MWLAGTALHAGVPVRARWRREPGPLRVRRVDGRATECVVDLGCAEPAARAARVRLADGRSVQTVEHALAAVTALGCFAGVVLEVEGPEAPLLDGGARRWLTALRALAVEAAGPTRRVRRAGEFTRGESRLRVCPGPLAVTVESDFRHRGIGAATVRWDGDPEDFARRIAPARTFGFLDEAEALVAAGCARGLDPSAVLVYGPDGRADARFAVPVDDEEPARHKLLDALGDLALVGARVEGRLAFERPGHARTLALLRAARDAGCWED